MSTQHHLHTQAMAWIPLSDGISFKPVAFFPGDAGEHFYQADPLANHFLEPFAAEGLIRYHQDVPHRVSPAES